MVIVVTGPDILVESVTKDAECVRMYRIESWRARQMPYLANKSGCMDEHVTATCYKPQFVHKSLRDRFHS